ncbi:MAG: FAD-dependent oxidoreductase [Lachnospiraceae bacterium]|nr:FAD-dependent oxidoreductase [Lachnospiraceae bacterium]
MIRLSQIKLPVKHNKNDIDKIIKKKLGLKKVPAYKMVKQSIDARKKNDIQVIYTVEMSLPNEERLVKRCKQASIVKMKKYELPACGEEPLNKRPIVVGMGPGGLFAAYQLAKAGYAPIVIERGEAVDDRAATVEHFWKTGELNKESNVQFGEGGAGTFSDGKLNTLVKDKFARNTYVLDTFVEHGAPEDILYTNKPHIGTDELRGVVRNMRESIIAMGGEVRFGTKLTDIVVEDGTITKIQTNDSDWMDCGPVILAIGHSARDTFELLYNRRIPMEPKPFAIGVRVEHPRTMINESQYGVGYPEEYLPTAAYKLTAKAANGRSVYSFCMCPGGYVVNASSEENRLVVNGMSNHDRMAENSNSAIIVNVTPEDFGSEHVLAGVEFQRIWEEKAFAEGRGKIPVQLFKDFEENVASTEYGEIMPCQKGDHNFGNLNNCLPDYVADAVIDGLYQFDKKIAGYARCDTILSGVESRTSSPVRIVRGEHFTSEVDNLYPCGEGAGYAGGITSAAMDGMKVAEAVIKRYKPEMRG